MNTLTTDKVYYSPEGKFFVSEREWPKEPHDVRCHSTHACNCASMAFESGANRDVVDGYDDNCPYRYKSALSRCLSEAYEVRDKNDEVQILLWDHNSPSHGWDLKPGTIYTLPEPREFEVKYVDCGGKNCHDKCASRLACNEMDAIAVLLPKKEEQKHDPSTVKIKVMTEFPHFKKFSRFDETPTTATNNLSHVSNDKQSEEQENEIWAQVINDARFYNGSPAGLTALTEHFKKFYSVSRKP